MSLLQGTREKDEPSCEIQWSLKSTKMDISLKEANSWSTWNLDWLKEKEMNEKVLPLEIHAFERIEMLDIIGLNETYDEKQ